MNKSQINTFSEGLNTDLHPLTTPNSILSDCVNGTILTHNGNEFILQNDMGNYQLSLTELPNNFIPIGIKEYGGIIYIVSYNPIDKLTQIGSYPSPQKHFSTDVPGKGDELRVIKLYDIYNKYTELNTQQATQLFSTEETFLLNPGDKYYIEMDLDKENKIYQSISFYILGEDKTLFELPSNEVKYHSIPLNIDTYDAVTWEVPGWLAYKFKIAAIDQFNLYLTSLEQPSFISGENVNLNYSVAAQVIVSDSLFTNDLNLINKLKIWLIAGHYEGEVKKYNNIDIVDPTFEQKVNHGIFAPIKEHKYTIINKFLYTGDISSYIYEQLSLSLTKEHTNFFVEAVPVLRDIDENEYSQLQSIVYDNFETTLTFDLNGIEDIDTLTAFNIYKYLVTDSGVTLNFDIASPTTTINSLKSELSIYNISERIGGAYDLNLIYGPSNLTDINYYGQNLISIPFDDKFEKENIYIMQYKIYYDEADDSKFSTYNKILITSEIFNSYYNSVNDYSTLSLTEWSSKLGEYINIEDLNLTYSENYNLNIYRNPGTEDKYICKIQNYDADYLEWAQNYPLKEENTPNVNNLPSLGVKSTQTVNLVNGIPIIFNNTGIWKNEKQQSFNLNVSGNNTTYIFNTDTLTLDIDLYKSKRINVSSERFIEKLFGRRYLADINDWNEEGVNSGILTKRISSIEFDLGKPKNPIYEFEYLWAWDSRPWPQTDIKNLTQLRYVFDTTTNPWTKNKIDEYNIPSSIPKNLYSRLRGNHTDYTFINFSNLKLHTDSSSTGEYFLTNSNDNFLVQDKSKAILGTSVRSRVSGESSWVLTDELIVNKSDSREYTDYKNKINQLNYHIYSIIPPIGDSEKTWYINNPINVIEDSKLSELLKYGTYSWNINKLTWLGKNISENTLNTSNLYINNININMDNLNLSNLKGTFNSSITAEKTFNLNIYANLEGTTEEGLTYLDLVSNLESTQLYLISSTNEIKNKLLETNSNNYYDIKHDLLECNYFNYSIIAEFDEFIKNISAEEDKAYPSGRLVTFYFVPNVSQNILYIKGDETGEGSSTDADGDEVNVHYIVNPTTWVLPKLDNDLLQLNHISQNFKSGI